MTTTSRPTTRLPGIQPTSYRRLAQLIVIALAMFVALLIPGTAEASNKNHHFYNDGGCPSWSIDGVLNDLDGDWDYDSVTNGDEVFQLGQSPCVYNSLCSSNPNNTWCTVKYYVVKHYQTCQGGYWSWGAIDAAPHGDWDHDGVTNHREAHNGANPCSAPCVNYRAIDITLNPWGDWDFDGRANQTEWHQGTNPCVYNAPVRLPHVQAPVVTYQAPAPAPKRLPHVVNLPAPAASTSPCPAGYPYYHPGNGKCYANPVNTPLGWG